MTTASIQRRVSATGSVMASGYVTPRAAAKPIMSPTRPIALPAGGRTMRSLALFLLGLTAMPALSDEGMWLLNDPPRDRLKQKYNFDLTDAWLEHARLASVRFNNGGSGSFVSANGLLITNHHIG